MSAASFEAPVTNRSRPLVCVRPRPKAAADGPDSRVAADAPISPPFSPRVTIGADIWQLNPIWQQRAEITHRRAVSATPSFNNTETIMTTTSGANPAAASCDVSATRKNVFFIPYNGWSPIDAVKTIATLKGESIHLCIQL